LHILKHSLAPAYINSILSKKTEFESIFRKYGVLDKQFKKYSQKTNILEYL